jgi:putative hydrolase of the HAD superfamily
MIRAVIFDLDGMVHLTKGLFSEQLSKDYGIKKEAVSEFFRKEYLLCRIGKLDTKEALLPYLEKWGWKKTVEEFMQFWYEYGNIDEEMVEYVHQLRMRGIKCILCTNNERYRMKHLIKKYALNDVFDELLMSYELGYCKPEEKMLLKIADVAWCDKDQILFCDDKEESIKIAGAFGFKTHRYMKFKEFRDSLKF